MTKKDGCCPIDIPIEIFSKPVDENKRTLLSFFINLFGKENAREIISLLSKIDDKDQKESELNFEKINNQIFNLLRNIFTSISKFSNKAMETKLLNLYKRANNIIISLQETSFYDMELELGLLGTTTAPTTNLAKRLFDLMSIDQVTKRYKHEKLRQDIIALILMILDEHNHVATYTKLINNINELFEQHLYIGKTGEITPQQLFSVHLEHDNKCIAVFDKKEKAYKYKHENDIDYASVKTHRWRTREIDKIGNVLIHMRTKSDFSIIRKAIAKSENGIIKITEDQNLTDYVGFMFITPVEKDTNMMDIAIKEIKNKYPDVKTLIKNKVGKGRGQSENVNFSRVLLYFPNYERPVEFMIMNQIDYLNYRFEISQAHELYQLKKTAAAADELFPELVYDHNIENVQKSRKRQKRRIKERLRKEG